MQKTKNLQNICFQKTIQWIFDRRLLISQLMVCRLSFGVICFSLLTISFLFSLSANPALVSDSSPNTSTEALACPGRLLPPDSSRGQACEQNSAPSSNVTCSDDSLPNDGKNKRRYPAGFRQLYPLLPETVI